jgi:hypothetical protein
VVRPYLPADLSADGSRFDLDQDVRMKQRRAFARMVCGVPPLSDTDKV